MSIINEVNLIFSWCLILKLLPIEVFKMKKENNKQQEYYSVEVVL